MVERGHSLGCMEVIGKERHMESKDYQYVEDPFYVTRREFVTIAGIIIALLALPAVWINLLVSAKNDYIRARAKGLYLDDERAKIRVSHENQAVARYYKEFGGKPLSGLSEELLHTRYFDRSKGLI